MTNLGDALQGAFTAHEAAERGRARDPHRTVRSIRRRKVAYAAGTGSAAAVAVGAIALGGTQLPRLAGVAPAGTSVTCTEDPHPPADAGAFLPGGLIAMTYVDTFSDTFEAVYPDGRREPLERDGNTYGLEIDGARWNVWEDDGADRHFERLAWVRTGDDSVMIVAPQANWSPWAWTVEAPETAPEGVDSSALWALLLGPMGAAFDPLQAGALPVGASVSVVVHEGDAAETYALEVGDTVPIDPVGDEVSSMDVVATLADGSTYTITANHDPDAEAPIACVTEAPSASPEPVQSCVPDTHVLGNPAAFGSLEYFGRAFIDPVAESYTITYADGPTEGLVHGDGGYGLISDGVFYGVWSESTESTLARQGDVLRADDGSLVVLPLGPDWDTWKWTLEVPQGAPNGVDTDSLSRTLLGSMSGPGGRLAEGAIPSGARAEILLREGTTAVSYPLGGELVGPGTETVGDDELASLELVVTLDDGTTYSLTAHHDPEASAPVVCAEPDPVAAPDHSAAPTSSHGRR